VSDDIDSREIARFEPDDERADARHLSVDAGLALAVPVVPSG
jgi:hypothetical protein